MPATTRSAAKAKKAKGALKPAPKKAISKPDRKTPRSFWRTIATARRSTNGVDTATAKKMAEEWKAGQKAAGIVNGRKYGHWKDERQGGTWVRVDPKTKKPV